MAQVETTNRRIGLTEAIAVAACLDVPLARLTSTGADTVTVGESRWTTAYLSAAIAGTADDLFGPDSYAAPSRVAATRSPPAGTRTTAPTRPPTPPGATPKELERRRRPRDRRPVDVAEAAAGDPRLPARRRTPRRRRPSASSGACACG